MFYLIRQTILLAILVFFLHFNHYASCVRSAKLSKKSPTRSKNLKNLDGFLNVSTDYKYIDNYLKYELGDKFNTQTTLTKETYFDTLIVGKELKPAVSLFVTLKSINNFHEKKCRKPIDYNALLQIDKMSELTNLTAEEVAVAQDVRKTVKDITIMYINDCQKVFQRQLYAHGLFSFEKLSLFLTKTLQPTRDTILLEDMDLALKDDHLLSKILNSQSINDYLRLVTEDPIDKKYMEPVVDEDEGIIRFNKTNMEFLYNKHFIQPCQSLTGNDQLKNILEPALSYAKWTSPVYTSEQKSLKGDSLHEKHETNFYQQMILFRICSIILKNENQIFKNTIKNMYSCNR